MLRSLALRTLPYAPLPVSPSATTKDRIERASVFALYERGSIGPIRSSGSGAGGVSIEPLRPLVGVDAKDGASAMGDETCRRLDDRTSGGPTAMSAIEWFDPTELTECTDSAALNRRGIGDDASSPCGARPSSSSSDETSSGSRAVSRRIVLEPSNDDRATDRSCDSATACAKSRVAPDGVNVESAGSSSSLSSVSLEMGVLRPARIGSAALHSAVVGVITTSRTRVSSVQPASVCNAASELNDMRDAYDMPLAGSPARLPCRLRARRTGGRPSSGELSVESDVLRDGDRGATPGLGGVMLGPDVLARPNAPNRVSSGEPASSGSELYTSPDELRGTAIAIDVPRSFAPLGVVSPYSTPFADSRAGVLGPGSGGNASGIERGLVSREADALGSHMFCRTDTALARSIAAGADPASSPARTDDALDGMDRELLAPDDSPLPGIGLS